MKTVHKSVLIWYSADEMYALVTDVAKYPEFLPWCDRSRVISVDADGMTAEVGLAFSSFHQSFTTRNTHVPGREVHLKLVDGPFSNLDGAWSFTPVGEEGERACRVKLDLSYGFSNFALQALVGPVFDKIASNLVEAFVKRAEQVYGRQLMPRVCLAYSPAPREIFEQVLEVPAGASIADAVHRSDLAQLFPGLDWQAMTPGIWGKAASWTRPLEELDRIELCRDLKVDPKVARRERFKRQGARGTGLFANRRQGGKAGY